MQDAFEVRIAHADLLHVLEGVADVVDARAAHADALRHQARAPVQVELAHVRRVRRIGDESERPDHPSPGQAYRNERWLVHAARHLAIPQPRERAAQPRRVDAVRDAPARAAVAQAHHQPGLALGAAIARGQDAQRAVIAVRERGRLVRVVEARRPHERPVAEHPEIALGQARGEFAEGHCARTI